MKTRILALAGAVTAALTVVALVDAQPIGPVGLQKCTTDSTLTGNCRTGTPLGVSIAGASCGAGSAVTAISGSGAGTCSSVGGTGTVTNVATGTGLTGGPITTTGTLSVSIAGASCSAGSAVTAISATGGGTCSAVGTVTSVASGAGLTGGPITGTGTLKLRSDCSDGQVLVSGGTGTTWTCSSPSAGSVTSSTLTANTIAKATGAAALANSQITDDGTTIAAPGNVNLGTATTGTTTAKGPAVFDQTTTHTGAATFNGNATFAGTTTAVNSSTITIGNSTSAAITFSNGPIGINNYAGKHLEWTEEWLSGSALTNGQSLNNWTCYQTGASSGCLGVNGLAGRPGIATNTAGTAATGASYMMVGGSGPIWVDFGTGSYFFEETFSFPTLSTSTNEYIVTTGFADFNGGANQVDGCYVDYDRLPVSTAPATGTISANTNKLQCWCSTGSTRTGYTMDGTIVSDESFTTVDASLVAGNYYRVKILMTGTTRAEFYVDSGSGYTKRCDINTHIPTGAVTGVLHGMLSSASTGASKVYYVDQTRWGVDLTNVRSP